MSTRIKIVLKDAASGGVWTGSVAIATAMQKHIAPQILKIRFPEDWNGYTRVKKLRYLMGYLPKNFELSVFQEPRATRIKKSAYREFRKKPQAIAGERVPIADDGRVPYRAYAFDVAAVPQPVGRQNPPVLQQGQVGVEWVEPDYIAEDEA